MISKVLVAQAKELAATTAPCLDPRDVMQVSSTSRFICINGNYIVKTSLKDVNVTFNESSGITEEPGYACHLGEVISYRFLTKAGVEEFMKQVVAVLDEVPCTPVAD